MRSDAREAAFKIIFAELFCENDGKFRENIIKQAKLTEEESEFARSLVSLTLEHREELTAEIDSRSTRYAGYRIYMADRAIMMIAIAEIRYIDGIPPVVSVSEAANLARKYSTERSADFVNGVLGGIINQ